VKWTKLQGWVFPEHGMSPVPCSLFPVPLRIPPPQFFFFCGNLASGGPAGVSWLVSLFPVPCSLFPQDPTERTCVLCSLFLSPYGKTHPCKTHFIGFFLRILRILLHLKFPSNSQDLTTPQTAFLKNHSAQAIGKLALFEKSCQSGKEEARTGWSNVDRESHMIGRKSYKLNQSDLR